VAPRRDPERDAHALGGAAGPRKSLIRNTIAFCFKRCITNSSAAVGFVPRRRGWNSRMSRMSRITCCLPLRGGMKRSTSSVKNSSPTLSLFVTAENAIVAATCAACSSLNCERVPK
jgi:hypothetical protein